MDLYSHFLICLHGVAINYLSVGATLQVSGKPAENRHFGDLVNDATKLKLTLEAENMKL